HSFDRGSDQDRQSHPAAVAASGPGQGRGHRCRPGLQRGRQRRAAGKADPRSAVRRRRDGTLGERTMGEARILLRDAADLTATVPAEVERKLTVLELLWNDGFVRKTAIILFLAAAWEVYGTILDNPLLFPTFHDTILTMFEKVRDGTIPLRAWASLKVLFMGYAAGIVLAAIFTI